MVDHKQKIDKGKKEFHSPPPEPLEQAIDSSERYFKPELTGSPVTQCQVNSRARTVSIPLENKHPLLCFGFCKKTNMSPLQLAIHLVQNCHAGEQKSQ